MSTEFRMRMLRSALKRADKVLKEYSDIPDFSQLDESQTGDLLLSMGDALAILAGAAKTLLSEEHET